MTAQQRSKAFLEGMEHARMGKSIHYNPYRNHGVESAAENSDWIDGWNAFHEAAGESRPEWSLSVLRRTML